MSKIDDLIAQYCPEGVEWKPLKVVCKDFIVPMRDRPKVFDGDIPWCRIEDKEGQYFNKSKSGLCVSEEMVKQMNLKIFPTGTVICSCSASLGSYAINSRPLITNQTFIGLVCGEDLYNKYLLYFMETQTNDLVKLATTGTIPYISRKKFEELIIPIPPLPVQEEIVSVLDKFTALEAELEVELEARTRQYEYYRNQLLSFEGAAVEWKALGEVGEFIRGKRFVRTDMVEDGFPCIHYGEMYTHYNIYATESKSFIRAEQAGKLRKAKKGDVVIVAAGETIDDIGKATAWLGESEVVTHDACFTFRSSLNPKFVAYFSRTKLFHNQIKKHISSGKISAINSKGLEKAKIPIPPIEEQERIVAILDKFDALVNDISTGLPAEIQARRQQYEYYRGKLLTFEPLSA
ncbi:restriction endonuclease subunit S [Sphingobacterium hotanense]|uniref:Restriction endonuclease subunit S n=2 Tax=Sphingobacterium hotanense TaxID=649196 RepID=A0ABT7NSR5_9SPHI|nr:restriction endonuclease subunit S [Sphingobacterium hotanense]